MLRGRTPECAALDALLVQAQAGESRVLVLRGEPGIGKTALLSNRETGAQLFLSARTVEWHLTHVFGKLHINSRGQLHGPVQS